MKRMNLYLDEALWETFRIRCLQRHVSASKQVGVLIAHWLQEHAPQEERSAEAEKRSPLGIHPRGLRGLKP